MPLFKRQAFALCALTALALGIVFAFWPSEPAGELIAESPATSNRASTAMLADNKDNPATAGQSFTNQPSADNPARQSSASVTNITGGGKIVVYVSGAVMRPGVYDLAEGARAEDALKAAGGPSPRADLEKINLAAKLSDGEQINVRHLPIDGTMHAVPASTITAASGKGGNQRGSKTLSGANVNINTAGNDELMTLPGIGPALAARIIAHRARHGFFRRIEDIMDVNGIGPAKFERMKAQIAVQ